jgi:hypothetical protein
VRGPAFNARTGDASREKKRLDTHSGGGIVALESSTGSPLRSRTRNDSAFPFCFAGLA